MKKIAVIGAGYVGLVTGACFAQKDTSVIIVENNQEKINALLNGKVPFYEPGLDQLVLDGINNKKLSFVSHIAEALAQQPEIIFSCVGTPSMPDGSADLSFVWQAAREIGRNINQYCLVVNKSTVPVGTAKNVKALIQEELDLRQSIVDFDVASNPEFLKEGDALNDFLVPDRIVIGVESKKAEQLLRELYLPFITQEHQLIVMNIESAELTKYASNAMLATRISFMNQIALLADKVGANIDQVKLGMAKDKRIGSAFLNAGIGYGGSCFPKDVKALIHMGNEYQQPMSLIKEVDTVNDYQREWFVQQIISYYTEDLKGKTAGIWGLAFKPETDDIRCAPALYIIEKLLAKGARVIAYDPVARDNVKMLLGDKITYAASSQQVLENSDFLVITTEWKEFTTAQPSNFLKLADKTVFDGRNCFRLNIMQQIGLTYFCVGRNSIGETFEARPCKAKELKECLGKKSCGCCMMCRKFPKEPISQTFL